MAGLTRRDSGHFLAILNKDVDTSGKQQSLPTDAARNPRCKEGGREGAAGE